jgi:guanine deaminase
LRRRDALSLSAGSLLALFCAPRARASEGGFIAEAFVMREEAVAAGDQSYGAVVVLNGAIIGRGRSRVIADRDNDRHAERVALKDAQERLGRIDLAGAIIYSSSIPCMFCQPVLARAGVTRMVHGRGAADAGPPRERGL